MTDPIQPTDNNSQYWIGLIIAILVVIGAYLGYSVTKNQSPSPSASPTPVATLTPTPTPSPSSSPTPSATPSPSPTPTATPTPSPTPSPTPTPVAQVYPNIGVNLEGVSDWAVSQMFNDLMKQSRHWGSVSAPWDQAAVVDQNGWPTTDAAVVVATSIVPGTYKLTFVGSATVSPVASSNVAIQNKVYSSLINTTIADVVVSVGATQLFLSFTGTNTGVKNVTLMRPNSSGTFNQAWLNLLTPFTTLRMMDLTQTNNSAVVNWSDRAHITDSTQASLKGVAWEHVIELANITGKDIWINIPDQATDDYVTQLSNLLKSGIINASVHIYVEYSNEVWNSIFSQTNRNLASAQAEVAAGDTSLSVNGTDTSIYYWGYRRIAKKLVRDCNIMRSQGLNPRCVLAGQIVQPSISEQQLLYIKANFGNPKDFIYAVSGAPYFGLSSSDVASTTLTLDQIFTDLDSSIKNTYFPIFKSNKVYTGSSWSGATLPSLAAFYGIKNVSYEGGVDLGQSSNSVSVKTQAQFDPRISTMVSELLSQWFGCNNSLFMWYNLASGYGQSGYWGLTNDISKNAPKLSAIKDVIAAPVSSMSCQ